MKLKSLIAAMFIVVFAAGMALAQEKKIDPYFQVRVFFGAHYADKDLGKDFDYMQNGMLTSRFGLKASLDKLSGQVEIGLKPNSYGNTLYLRHLYAKYKSDMGVEVLFGQTWTPYFALMGCQSEDFVGIGYGATYDGRLPQLRATWNGLYVAALSPRGITNAGDSSSSTSYTVPDDGANDVDAVPVTIATEYDNFMPKVAIGYEYKSDMFEIGPGFAINYTKKAVTDNTVAGGGAVTTTKVTSFIGYAHGKVKAGDFYTKFNATFAQNPKDFGIYQVSIAPLDGNGVSGGFNGKSGNNDVYVFEGFVELGYKLGIGAASAGVGYVKNFEDAAARKEQRLAVYGQICMPVVKGFKVTPTLLYVNQLDDEGSELIAGVKLQANF